MATFDLREALDTGPWTPIQKRTFALCTIALVVEGLASQLLGLAIPSLVQEWGVSRSAFTSTAVAGLIGVMIGNSLGGAVGDRMGRKWAIIASILVYGVTDLAAVFMRSPAELGAVRLLAGLGIGAMLPNTVALLAETTPAYHRSRVLGCALLGLPAGTAVAGLLGSMLVPTFGWRSLFVMGAVLPILLAAVCAWALIESPDYLSRFPSQRDRLTRLLAAMKIALPADAVARRPAEDERTTLRALFGAGMARDTLGLWGLKFFSYIVTYTFASWGPATIAEAGLGLSISSLSLTAWSVGAVGAIAVGFALQRFGSRLSLLLFGAIAVVPTVVLAIQPLAAMGLWLMFLSIALIGTCAVAVTSASTVMGSHIYPTSHRSTGLGIALAVGRLGSMAGVIGGDLSLLLRGASGLFILMGAALWAGIACALLVRNQIPAKGRPNL